MATLTNYGDMSLSVALEYGTDNALLQEMGGRVNASRSEHDVFRTWCDRVDKLYFAESFTAGGADLWPEDPSVRMPGRSHLSINTPQVYVDIPAALLSVPPVENMLATDNTEESRAAASAFERLYVAYKVDQDYDLKYHKANTVAALYGRTFGRVYWDRDQKKVCFDVAEQPRNVYVGYKSDSYEKVEWAAYVQRMAPNAVQEEFGVDVYAFEDRTGRMVPNVSVDTMESLPSRSWLSFGEAQIEVWDYWYRKPAGKQGKKGEPRKMETWNVVFAGTKAIRGPVAYPEYDGEIPCLPLFNNFLPGIPNGRPELYDMEQLIRETMERMTSGSQMIAAGTAGDFWQLIGPDAATVPEGAKPVRNKVIAPGPGNRIESITPFIAQFQLEQYLGRLDRYKAEVSGLNDLLLGLAPVQALNSSKAINAMIANYEARISIARRLRYSWRKKSWEMVVKVWAAKDKTVGKIVAAGGGVLDIKNPSLTPRDDMETAQRALNLVNGKLWSQRTGMDSVGIDDPETEQDMIREERTDATMFPAEVQVMAQLLATLQSLGLQAPPDAQATAEQQLGSGQNDLRTALGGATPGGTVATQGAEVQGNLPPEALTPGGTPPGGQPFATGPAAPGGDIGLAQTMLKDGKASSRILTQVKLGRR